MSRTARDRLIADFQALDGPGALVLSLKAGGTGLNLTAASHVVLYDRWWNPAVEDQARDRAWRIGQTRTVICHRLICPGTVDERVEEVVAGKRRIADLVLPKSSSLADLDSDQLRVALGIRPDAVLTDDLLADRSGCARMSQNRRRKPAARKAPGRRPTGREFWGTENRDEEPPAPIRPSDDPTAMIRSLGPPPLPESRDGRRALLRRRVRQGRVARGRARGRVGPARHLRTRRNSRSNGRPRDRQE